MWLRECRGAVVALILHSLFMAFLLRPVVRALLPKAKEHSFLGLKVSGKKHDRYTDAIAWIDPILWTVGWSLVAAMAQRRFRPALEQADRRSHALYAEAARAAADGNAVASARLREQAQKLDVTQLLHAVPRDKSGGPLPPT
jgi:hypothetical protein